MCDRVTVRDTTGGCGSEEVVKAVHGARYKLWYKRTANVDVVQFIAASVHYPVER